MTGSEDKGSQSPRDDFPGNLERLQRADPLLAPYFEEEAREKTRVIADRLIKVKREKFGNPPEDNSQK